jgi:AcrR family transcriptional regulator
MSEEPSDIPADAPLTDKQQRVLEAAIDVFAERGFHGASTSEIAKRAGVAEGTLFKQYKTKKELLIGALAPFLLRTVAPILLADVRQILVAPHATFEDFVRALYRNRGEFISKHQRMVRVVFQELPFHAEVREMVKDTIVKAILPDATALVQRFQREGQVVEADPLSIVRLVVGTFFVYAVSRVVVAPKHAWNDDSELQLMVQMVSRGLRPADG